jgi:hypothetical protein
MGNGNEPTHHMFLGAIFITVLFSRLAVKLMQSVGQLTGNGNVPARHVSLRGISITFFV